MNQQSVFVHDETLIFHKNGSPIEFQMGSPDWYCWVETASTYAFHSPEGSFTAYQEQAGNRRGGCYWKACCQRGGKLSSVYLGKAELCWLLVISARSIRPLSAPSHVSRRLPIPQMKSTIKMHSSDYPIIFKKGSRTLCMGFLPSSSG